MEKPSVRSPLRTVKSLRAGEADAYSPLVLMRKDPQKQSQGSAQKSKQQSQGLEEAGNS